MRPTTLQAVMSGFVRGTLQSIQRGFVEVPIETKTAKIHEARWQSIESKILADIIEQRKLQ
jgi:hypothetical protein